MKTKKELENALIQAVRDARNAAHEEDFWAHFGNLMETFAAYEAIGPDIEDLVEELRSMPLEKAQCQMGKRPWPSVHQGVEQQIAPIESADEKPGADWNTLRDSLQWAIGFIEDNLGVDAQGTVKHECEFDSAPESGFCEVHHKFWNSKELLAKTERAADGSVKNKICHCGEVMWRCEKGYGCVEIIDESEGLTQKELDEQFEEFSRELRNDYKMITGRDYDKDFNS